MTGKITRKHIVALDCLRQFANEHFSLFQGFIQDGDTPEEKVYETAQEQIRLAEELRGILEALSC